MRIVIVGAGASGLMAAIAAAECGAEVTVLECAGKPARKIYATGNGKCNFTNKQMDSGFYRSGDDSLRLVKAALGRFDEKDTIAFFQSLGMFVKERGGYCYPSTGQASTVAEILVRRCEALGVQIYCDTKVLKITKRKQCFTVSGLYTVMKEKKAVKQTEVSYEADRVIVAAGTTAGGFGCEVTGKAMLKEFPLSYVPTVPALAALKCAEKEFFKMASGVRVDADIRIVEQESGKVLAAEQGELQITDYGISGIPVFQISRFGAYALREGKRLTAVIDFLPEYTYDMLYDAYGKHRDNYGEQSVAQVFSYIFNEKLVRAVLTKAKTDMNQCASKLPEKELKRILTAMKRCEVTPVESMPVKNAQVCAGGVDTTILNEQFMVTQVPGLYIVGELVDVDGICGGYNLQFAWSSGRIAGTDAVEE